MGVGGASVIAQLVLHTNTLEKLDLSINNLCAQSGAAIAHALESNKTVLSVDLHKYALFGPQHLAFPSHLLFRLLLHTSKMREFQFLGVGHSCDLLTK